MEIQKDSETQLSSFLATLHHRLKTIKTPVFRLKETFSLNFDLNLICASASSSKLQLKKGCKSLDLDFDSSKFL